MRIYSFSFAVIIAVFGLLYSPATITTIIIVRHAEKAAAPADNPPLTEAGKTRAEALARITKSAGIKAIYATQFIRTQQTVQPLADKLGIEIKQVDARDPKGLANRLISDNAGDTVLVAGHSNTLPQIIEALGGSIPPIQDDEHDNLYIVTVYEPGKAKVITLKY
jgi:2,3-bisphosphoglycerate-dependent phosphoglycerate mutase